MERLEIAAKFAIATCVLSVLGIIICGAVLLVNLHQINNATVLKEPISLNQPNTGFISEETGQRFQVLSSFLPGAPLKNPFAPTYRTVPCGDETQVQAAERAYWGGASSTCAVLVPRP